MYTEPKIVTDNNLESRSYILFYFNGERIRIYNGKIIDLKLFPNKATNLKDRSRLLTKLSYELKKSLESGWNPSISKPTDLLPATTIKNVFEETLKEKLSCQLSNSYKRDLNSISSRFLNFLTPEQQQAEPNSIASHIIETFLNQYRKSNTYYMNQRRILGVIFSELKRKKLISDNPVKETKRAKVKSTLHQIYQEEQIRPLLTFIQQTYPNLYICCLLAYGCLLRPHEESRLLCKRNFNTNITSITLAGDENKSGTIRVVHIPPYVQIELKPIIDSITDSEFNIFSKELKPLNQSYFNTQWGRLKQRNTKQDLKLLQPNQTIYSFRHTAAVNIYLKTKDIYLLQQLLGHSDMIVTIKYLRGLGVIVNDSHIGFYADL